MVADYFYIVVLVLWTSDMAHITVLTATASSAEQSDWREMHLFRVMILINDSSYYKLSGGNAA